MDNRLGTERFNDVDRLNPFLGSSLELVLGDIAGSEGRVPRTYLLNVAMARKQNFAEVQTKNRTGKV